MDNIDGDISVLSTCLFAHMQSMLLLFSEKSEELWAPHFQSTPTKENKNHETVKPPGWSLRGGFKPFHILTSSFETSSSSTASKTNSCFSTYSVKSTCKRK